MKHYESFREQCQQLESRLAEISRCCGRPAGAVRILPVTKTHPVEAVLFAHRYGFKAVGENRVQEAMDKRSQCGESIGWELIGHLQSNKARLAVEHFDRIQSVDSIKLISKLAQAAREAGKVQRILLQINAGRDPAKFGAEPEEAHGLLEKALGETSLQVEGLMTIAPLSEDKSVARSCFANLRVLRDQLETQFQTKLPELSMGMSDDLEEAVAEGSTLIRVGTALFGSRT